MADLRRTDPLDRFALIACLVVGLAARTILLGRDDLWSDEVHTLRTMSLPLGEVTTERLGAGHVPLYFLLLEGWCRLFGTSQFALRLPSALTGTLLLLPAFALFRRILPPAPARWGLAVLAVHPLLVELSREARMYSLAGLLFLVLAESAVASIADGRVRRRFWIAAVLGPTVHPSWAFGALALLAWIVSESRRSDAPGSATATAAAVRRVTIGLVASVAMLVVVLLLAATPQHQELTRRPWQRELLVFVLRPLVGSDLRAPVASAIGLAVVGWLVCCYRGWFEGDSRVRRFALWVALGVPAVSVLSGVTAGLPWGPARYVQAATVGATALAALAAMHSSRTVATLRADAARAGAASALPPGFAWSALRRDPVGVPWLFAALTMVLVLRMREPRVAWSDAAETIRRDVPAGAVIRVDDDGSRIVLGHYLGLDTFPAASAAGRWTVRHGAAPDPAPTWYARLDVSGAGALVRLVPP